VLSDTIDIDVLHQREPGGGWAGTSRTSPVSSPGYSAGPSISYLAAISTAGFVTSSSRKRPRAMRVRSRICSSGSQVATQEDVGGFAPLATSNARERVRGRGAFVVAQSPGLLLEIDRGRTHASDRTSRTADLRAGFVVTPPS